MLTASKKLSLNDLKRIKDSYNLIGEFSDFDFNELHHGLDNIIWLCSVASIRQSERADHKRTIKRPVSVTLENNDLESMYDCEKTSTMEYIERLENQVLMMESEIDALISSIKTISECGK